MVSRCAPSLFGPLMWALMCWGTTDAALADIDTEGLALRSSDALTHPPTVIPANTATLRLSLAQAQQLALSQHSTALGSSLDKEVQALQREVGENDLAPKFSLTGQTTRQLPGSLSAVGTTGSVNAGSTLKLPSSTQLELGLTQTHNAPEGGASTQALTQLLQVVQPLLRNFGPAQATLVRDTARLNDAIASYQREQLLDGLYISVTLAYLDALQAQQQTAVAERARSSVAASREVNEALYAAGRIAKLDLLQLDADMAQAELNLAQARNAAAAAKARLLQWLGPAMAQQSPQEVLLTESSMRLDIAEPSIALDSVLQQRKDWGIALASIDAAKLGRQQAHNDALPQLDLVLGVQNTTGAAVGLQEGTDYSAGLRFSVPLDRTLLRLQKAQATVNQQKLELAATDLRNQIADEVSNAAREATFAAHQLALSETTVALNQQKLDAEREKFRAGRSSAFQLSSAQDALNAAEIARVQAEFAVYRARLEQARSTGAVQQLREQALP